MLIRKVEGNSMLPGLAPGAVVVAWRRGVRTGDIVIARQAGREVIKRVTKIMGGRFYLEGDNSLESADSREFGPVKKEDILGIVMIKLPAAVAPPKPLQTYAPLMGWIAGMIMSGAALLHLFRIDTLIPLLDNALPGGNTSASLIAVAIVVIEVFAVPFLLRMKLSPLMHLKSGLNAVLAPLAWLLICIWTYGHGVSTAEFGEFLNAPSSIPLIMLNVAWLGFNLWTLWLLGFSKLSDFKKLS